MDVIIILGAGTIPVVGILINVGKMMIEILLVAQTLQDTNIILAIILAGVTLLPSIEPVIAIVQHAMAEAVEAAKAAIPPTIGGLDPPTIAVQLIVRTKEQGRDQVEDNMQTATIPVLTVIPTAAGVTMEVQWRTVLRVFQATIWLMIKIGVQLNTLMEDQDLNILVILEDVFQAAQQNITLLWLKEVQQIASIQVGQEEQLGQVKLDQLITTEEWQTSVIFAMITVKNAGIDTIQTATNVLAITICGDSKITDVKSNVPWELLDQDLLGEDSTFKHPPPTILLMLTIEFANFVMQIVFGVKFLPATATTARTTQPYWIQVPNVLLDLTQLTVLSVLRDR